VNSNFSRRRLGWVIVALAAAAFAAPAAQARHATGEDVEATSSSPSTSVASTTGYAANQWNASGREIDRLGPKYVPLHHPLSPAPVSVVKVATPGGFDWADAAIGAAVSGIALALVAGLALLVTRRSRRAGVPERSELAST
jgi:hypothetical protein